MPVPQQQFQQQQEVSCMSKMKMGFMMGFVIGTASTVILGGFGYLKQGYRGRELMNHVGKAALQGGGSFGVFMAVGQGIRC